MNKEEWDKRKYEIAEDLKNEAENPYSKARLEQCLGREQKPVPIKEVWRELAEMLGH